MTRLLRMVFSLFSRHEKKKLIWLFMFIMVAGLLEAMSISSVMPFLAVVANPEVIQTNVYVNAVYTYLNFSNVDYFLLFLGSVALLALLIGNAFTAFTIWMLLRFSNMQEHIIAERLLKKYLYKPYVYFVTNNTAELSKNIISEVSRVVIGVLIPGMQAIARVVIAIFIVVLLFLVDPALAFSVSLVLGSVYSFFYYLIRKKLYRIGSEASLSARERFIAANEAFGGIKDLKLLGKEEDFLRRFSEPSFRHALYTTESRIFSQIPKYAFETIAFGGILLIVLYLIAVKKDMEYVMPIIGLYAFSGYRLMNALHVIFTAVTECRYHFPALEILHDDLAQNKDIKSTDESPRSEVVLTGDINLQDIVFMYPNVQVPNIKNISLEINVNQTIGIVGATGSGKTTIIDLILGLLTPDSGKLSIGGVDVNEANVREWQERLGYVPQSIYLMDKSIAQNIAFGVHPEKINMDDVERAARIANIHGFITDELPHKYQTLVGEKGIKLSGGQRQRIGIARALYHHPDVLVLDEATSALDGATENIVMDAMQVLSSKITIVIVAHRLSTVKECDCIYVLDKGELVGAGDYAKLEAENDYFKSLIDADASFSVNKQD